MTSILLNGVLQITEALIAFYFYESISNFSNKKLKRISFIFIGYFFMYFVNIAFDYNAIINTIIMTAFHFAFIKILYKKAWGISAFYTLLFICLVAISELSVIHILSIFSNNEFKEFTENAFEYALLIIFSKSLLFIALRVISAIINKFTSNGKVDFVYFIYPVSLIIILTIYNILSIQYNFSSKSRLLLSLSSIILIFAVIITCIYQQTSSQKEQELMELKAIKQKQDTENTYFELLEHQNEELQIFVHDMQKHLQNIYNLSENSIEAKEYITTISSDLSDSNKMGKTSNKLLDLIIDKYDYISKKENIIFEKNIHASDISFIKDSDLTSIFNNLLDNAVDAAQKSSKPFIQLNINGIENMIIIDIVNSCDTPPLSRKNELLSSKSNTGLHGYGYKSICRAVKKYNGDIEWEYSDTKKEFNVSILFNIS